MERIINSNIDTDLYKLTMGQAVFHNFPDLRVGYEFINRGKTEFPDRFDIDLQKRIEMMAEIKTQPSESHFLENGCGGVFTKDYLDWFANYQFNPDEVKISRENGGVSLHVDGLWERTIYWEVPLMAQVSELFFKETGQKASLDWEERCIKKALDLKEAGAKYADFGTRRRFSYQVHNRVVEILKQYGGEGFLGTSNIKLAMDHNLRPIGTFAHEWVMALSGIYGPELANKMALEIWAKEFNGKLATALTDTLTTDVFLQSFDGSVAETFKAFRQDSGSPEKWTEKIINKLHQLGIDPLTRTALYSDALTTERALEILRYNEGKIQTLFGIGTHFTNDVGVIPLNMVIKLLYVQMNGQRIGVCKFSDDLGKVSGDPQAIVETAKKLNLEVPRRR